MTIWASALAGAAAKDIYFTATGHEAGRPLIFRSIKRVPEGITPAKLPYLVSITWRYDRDANNGMPDRDTNNGQVLFEDALMPLDVNGTSRLMLVVTGNGRKEWHWYVRNVESWMKKLNHVLVGKPIPPIRIENSFQPDWSLYQKFVAGVRGLRSAHP